ncbi:conserved hypothetical protein [[Clostridium] ultunense Esp]|nr:conserved hypothetical protein [[Clostridium] ultunense Esp]
MANERNLYGGQAVIEGVMFGGKHVYVTAIRRKDNRIEYFEQPKTEQPWTRWLKKIPFIRGIVALIQSSANGSRHLSFAAEKYDLDDGDEDATEKTMGREEKTSWSFVLGVAVMGVISLIVGKIIFTGVPALLAGLLDPILYSVPQGTPWERFESNIIEGVIKIFLLLLYLYAISITPLIKRLFQYHGAEHKVINAYERGLPLTVENVKKSSRLHYRCGSSFIIFTAIVGVLVYSVFNYFFPYHTLWERILERILFIPVVIGLSYETLFLTNKMREIPILRYLGYPGLWLQLLTTKEPNTAQIEVAIASFNRMRELDESGLVQVR